MLSVSLSISLYVSPTLSIRPSVRLSVEVRSCCVVLWWQSFMVVDAILERNPEVSFKSAIDMDRVSYTSHICTVHACNVCPP